MAARERSVSAPRAASSSTQDPPATNREPAPTASRCEVALALPARSIRTAPEPSLPCSQDFGTARSRDVYDGRRSGHITLADCVHGVTNSLRLSRVSELSSVETFAHRFPTLSVSWLMLRGMTLATDHAPRLSATAVAEFICDQWKRAGEDAEVASGTFVLVPSIRRVEWVLGDVDDPQPIREAVGRFVSQAVDVSLVVPVHLLGSAHFDLRGITANLVGWVDQEDGRPHFLAPERA